MSADADILNDGEPGFSIAKLPKTALQAIYNAVTGKTESMSRWNTGNSIIRFDNIENLNSLIRERLEHYEQVIAPTTVIVVKTDTDKSYTYSSFERFKATQIFTSDITSDITIKIETLIRIPNTPHPQRLVVTLLLDSALPMLISEEKELDIGPGVRYYFAFAGDWRTVKTTVDYVDYLVAKTLTDTVAEWFDGLEKVNNSATNRYLLSRYATIDSIVSQSNRIGLAVFLTSFVILRGSQSIELKDLILATSLGILVYALFAAIKTTIVAKVFRRLASNMMPSVILLSEGDNRCFERFNNKKTGILSNIAWLATTTVFAIATNIFASWIYAQYFPVK